MSITTVIFVCLCFISLAIAGIWYIEERKSFVAAIYILGAVIIAAMFLNRVLP